MDKSQLKVALIEVYEAHGECLFTQLQLLKELFEEVVLICPTAFQSRVSEFNHSQVVFKDINFSKVASIRDYRDMVNQHNFDIIIFNTAQGKLKRLFYFRKPFNSKKVVGTIHDAKKLKESLGQKIISMQIDGYFVLSDYVKKSAEALAPAMSFETYYPIEFPDYNTTPLQKKEGEVWVAIPGNLEYKRRDFKGFFDLIKREKLNKNVRLILLGRSTHKRGNFKEASLVIQQAGIEDQVVLFESFVNDELFHSYLKQSDYILPLLHPEHSSLKKYQYKISGSFNLAYAYDIPLLLHKEFGQHEEFSLHPTVFYETSGLIHLLNQLPVPKKTPSPLRLSIQKKQHQEYSSFLLEEPAVL